MMKAIISVPISNKKNITNGSLASALVLKAFKEATFIPNNATNGDVIKALFPKIEDNFSNIIDLKMWWNAKYKADGIAKLKSMPQKKGIMYEAISRGMEELDSEWVYRFEGYNACIDDILGDENDR